MQVDTQGPPQQKNRKESAGVASISERLTSVHHSYPPTGISFYIVPEESDITSKKAPKVDSLFELTFSRYLLFAFK